MIISSILVFFSVSFIYFKLISFIFLGLVLYKMSEVNGLGEKSFLSFVPVGNIYILHKILGDRVPDKFRNHLWIIYGVFFILGLMVSKLVIVKYFILSFYVYLLMKELSDKYLLHGVICLLSGGLSAPFSLFRYRETVLDVERGNIESFSDVVTNLRNAVEEYIDENDDEGGVR